MRLILILVPISVAVLVLSIVSVLSGSVFAGGGFGGGPAAMGAALFLVLTALSLGLAFVVIALPLLVILGVTIVCAVLAGYRIFRWLRWAGILTNAVGLAYFLWLPSRSPEVSFSWSGCALYGLFIANALLFYFLPCRPDTVRSQRMIAPAHLICWAVLPGLLFFAMSQQGKVGDLVFMLPVLLIYTLPFYFNHRATRLLAAGEAFGSALKTLLCTALSGALFVCLSPPLGMPLMLSCLLLLGFLEMKYLYPEVVPTTGSLRSVLVLTMGRLPD